MMETVAATVASLGPPMWIESLEAEFGSGARIARWSHGSARIQVSDADAIRVVLSLSSSQQVRHLAEGQALSARGLAGHVSLFPAGVPSETIVEGDADVVQMFVRPGAFGSAARRGPILTSLFEANGDELKQAFIQLFVAVQQRDSSQRDTAQLHLRQVVSKLVSSPAGSRWEPAHPALPAPTLQQVEQLIDEAIDGRAIDSPDLQELAAAANFSVSHFIRAFRNTVGSTPHQLVMARRSERALQLLKQARLTVADVADAAGYGSPAHFVASFRKRYGVTPGAYQRAVGSPSLIAE